MRSYVPGCSDARCVCIPSQALPSPPSGSCRGTRSQSEHRCSRNQSTAASLCCPEKSSLVWVPASAAWGQAGERGQILMPLQAGFTQGRWWWFNSEWEAVIKCSYSVVFDVIFNKKLSKTGLCAAASSHVFISTMVCNSTEEMWQSLFSVPLGLEPCFGWRAARAAGPSWLLTGPQAFWLTAHSVTRCTCEPVLSAMLASSSYHRMTHRKPRNNCWVSSVLLLWTGGVLLTEGVWKRV